jgi:hypothetical protein
MKFVLIYCAVAFAPVVAADALRDPTRPPVPTHAALATPERPPVLSAILGSKWDRVAIFNGQLVRSGESAGSYTIEAVFEDGVRYRHGGVSQELYLPHAAVFKRPSTAAARAPMGDH